MTASTTARLDGTNSDDITRAAAFLRDGALVALPTETVYGLAARSDDEDAIQRVYAAKGRAPQRALSVLVPDFDTALTLWKDGPWIESARALAGRFWPGPLTIICPAMDHVSTTLRGNLESVGLRCPAHPIAQHILREVALPLVAPSANLSESPSPTSADAVEQQLGGRIAAILDGGPSPNGLESTIIALDADGTRLVRAGALALSELNAALPSSWKISDRHINAPNSTRLLPDPASHPISVEVYVQGSWRTYSEASVDALIQGLHTYLSTLSDGERSGAAWRAGSALREDPRFAGVCYLLDRYLRNR